MGICFCQLTNNLIGRLEFSVRSWKWIVQIIQSLSFDWVFWILFFTYFFRRVKLACLSLLKWFSNASHVSSMRLHPLSLKLLPYKVLSQEIRVSDIRLSKRFTNFLDFFALHICDISSQVIYSLRSHNVRALSKVGIYVDCL